MVEFNFFLSSEDVDRLFFLKEQEGWDDTTANEYARRLLEQALRQKCPHVPEA